MKAKPYLDLQPGDLCWALGQTYRIMKEPVMLLKKYAYQDGDIWWSCLHKDTEVFIMSERLFKSKRKCINKSKILLGSTY